MRDVITRPGFVHIPPRERLFRHALNKIRDRAHSGITRTELEALCVRFADGEFDAERRPAEEGLGERSVYHTRLWGKKVRVVFDNHYGVVVTVIMGWQVPLFRGIG